MEVNNGSSQKRKTIKDLLIEIDSINKRVKLLEEVIQNTDCIDKVNSINLKITNKKNVESISLDKKNQDAKKEPIKEKNNKVSRSFMCKKCKNIFNWKTERACKSL